MIDCRIMDDQYGESIYNVLKDILPNAGYPIKTNICSPIFYLNKIKDGDLILLDNYFPGENREEPLGDEFLYEYLKIGLKCNIICISDYGKVLIDKYTNWELAYKKGDIIGRASTKDGNDILNLILKKYPNLG